MGEFEIAVPCSTIQVYLRLSLSRLREISLVHVSKCYKLDTHHVFIPSKLLTAGVARW